MFAVSKSIFKAPMYYGFSNTLCKKDLFYFLVVIFNLPSKSRIKLVGPDRACAEWLMRNGAFIKWKGRDTYVTDYNSLPLDLSYTGQYYLKEVDATNAAISHHGFSHFEGCNYVDKIKFSNCIYIEDKAFNKLSVLKNSLEDLEVTHCKSVTGKGLKSLKDLGKLKRLKFGGLDVDNMNDIVDELQKALPSCEITVAVKK